MWALVQNHDDTGTGKEELNQSGSAAAPEPAKSDRLAMKESRMTYFRKLFYRAGNSFGPAIGQVPAKLS
jgi:hypothetical protein